MNEPNKIPLNSIKAKFMKEFFQQIAKYLLGVPFKVFGFLIKEVYHLIKWVFLEVLPKKARIWVAIGILVIIYCFAETIWADFQSFLHGIFSQHVIHAILNSN